jgi:tellurite resistance protein TehA-like permease
MKLSEDKALTEKAKKVFNTLNWYYVIAILGIIGVILFLIWYFYKKSKEKTKQ